MTAIPESGQGVRGTSLPSVAHAFDPGYESFPKAPLVPFPVESTSLAMTGICDVLTASRVPSVLLGADSMVRYISDAARILLAIPPRTENLTKPMIEHRLRFQLPDLNSPYSASIVLANRSIHFSMIPLSGGATGAVLLFRPQEMIPTPLHGSFVSYVRETVLFPLRGLREVLIAGSKNRGSDLLLDDCASTIEQILSSLELAPGVEESETQSGLPIASVVKTIAERISPTAEAKGIKLQFDLPTVDEVFRDWKDLELTLTTLMENSLHYVPPGGQIVIGQRFMEYKGKSLLLFFVMDNGPIIPESLREEIFSPDFIWKPSSAERTGRGLSLCREFAVAHGGQIWVESKTGKTSTFFIRVKREG